MQLITIVIGLIKKNGTVENTDASSCFILNDLYVYNLKGYFDIYKT